MWCAYGTEFAPLPHAPFFLVQHAQGHVFAPEGRKPPQSCAPRPLPSRIDADPWIPVPCGGGAPRQKAPSGDSS